MRFTAKYSSLTGTYYRTVYADTVNEAIRMAQRFANKGFLCVKVEQVWQ